MKDVTTKECSDVAHVEPVSVTEYLDTVQMDYKGNCEQRTLKQEQQVSIAVISYHSLTLPQYVLGLY